MATNIVTTDAGRNATANADQGGFLVDLVSFAVTERDVAQLSVADTALEGTPVFSGDIQSIEVVSAATVRCLLYIPPGKPITGNWNLREIGIYLKTGELFGHGRFRTPFVKSGEFGVRIYVYVTCARLGEVVNLAVGSTVSLDSGLVRGLPDPGVCGTNAIVVQDGSTVDALTSAGNLAVRYGATGAKWAFLGHDLVYRGIPSSVGPNFLGLDPTVKGGFWVNDNEVVTIHISSGHGAGESRRCRFTKDDNKFTVLEKNFSNLGLDSIFNVWRETKHQLPSRTADIPEYFMLGHGRNTWKKELDSVATATYDLSQMQIQFIGNGTATYNFPAAIPTSALTKHEMQVFVNGERQGVDDFNILVRSLSFTLPPAVGDEVCVVCYNHVTSTGSALVFLSADYPVYTAGTRLFQLPNIPDNKDRLMVFVNNLFVHPSHFNLIGSAVKFTDLDPVGVVSVVVASCFAEKGAKSEVTQINAHVTSGTVDITVPVTKFEKRNTFVHVEGKLITQDLYTTSNGKITFKTAISQDADVQVYISAALPIADQPALSISGDNTGPVWADPAGSNASPNTIIPQVLSFHSTGGTSYNCPAGCPDKNHVMVFIGGQFQAPDTFSFAGSTVTLNNVPPAAVDIDIVGFTSKPSAGSKANCKSFTIQTNGGTAYPISGFSAVPPILIFVGGVYQHASQYVLTPTTLTFSVAPPNNKTIECWVYDSLPDAGSATILSMTASPIVTNKMTYTHDIEGVIQDTTGNIQNSILFASTVYQSKSNYTVANASPSTNAINLSAALNEIPGNNLISFMVLSGRGQTRLITRDEFNTRNAGVIDDLANKGWALLPSGMIIQTARGTTVTGKADQVFFPIQFPNKCISVITCEQNSVGWLDNPPQPTIHGMGNPTQAGFEAYCTRLRPAGIEYAVGISYNYIAIGF